MKKGIRVSKWNYKPSEGRKMSEKVITVEGEAQTIAEIVARYSQGIPLPVRPVQYFNGEDFETSEVDNPDADLVDKMQEVEQLTAKLSASKSSGDSDATRKRQTKSEATEEQSESPAPGSAPEDTKVSD